MQRPNIYNYIDDAVTYLPGTIEVLQKFKSSKTFKGTLEFRLAHMQILINDLAIIYGMEKVPIVLMQNIDGEHSGASEAVVDEETGQSFIIMRGKLSIITLLHEFGHLMLETGDQLVVQRWAINLFRKVYPRQFLNLNFHSGSGMFFK